jgi:hypothetical protein
VAWAKSQSLQSPFDGTATAAILKIANPKKGTAIIQVWMMARKLPVILY